MMKLGCPMMRLDCPLMRLDCPLQGLQELLATGKIVDQQTLFAAKRLGSKGIAQGTNWDDGPTVAIDVHRMLGMAVTDFDQNK